MKMYTALAHAMVLVVLSGVASISFADMPAPVNSADIKWGPAPPILPAGAQMTVLAGDPGGTGLVTIRLKVPAGYQIPPHWHPTDEHVTVISGIFELGMGDKLDKKHSKRLRPGGYAVAPANMHHFAWAKTDAIVQVNLIAPFQLTYVNPADDPSPKK